MLRNGTNSSFGSLKQIDVGGLNVEYAETGPSDGQVVMLLHGWPYDIHSYADVAPRLTHAGYRVIGPLYAPHHHGRCRAQSAPGSAS